MHSYDGIKARYGKRVTQTIDSPVTIFDYWELADGFAAILVILLFGVVLYEWSVMLMLLTLLLVAWPWMRRHQPRGILLHWPYRRLGMSLPGLMNPKGPKTYSD